MTWYSELYGWRHGTVEHISQQTGHALDVTFELHESLYRGGDYCLWRGSAGDKIVIQRNFRDDEGYLAEEAFGSYPVICYATRLGERVRALLQAAPGVDLLRSTQLD